MAQKTISHKLLACALSLSILLSLSGPAMAAGAVLSTTQTGTYATGSPVGAVNAGLNSVPSLKGSNVLALTPSLSGGSALSATPTVSQQAKLSAAAAPALAARAAAAGLKAAPADPAATPAAAPESAQGQLERIAKESPSELAKDFDGLGAAADSAAGVPMFGKLGRVTSTPDARTLNLAKYMAPDIDGVPEKVDFTAKVDRWGMMLNDKIGDCTVAACGHQIQQWTANVGRQQNPSDSAILAAYKAISGYQPGKPDTDQGANMLDVLKYWRKLGIAGHKIGAFASVGFSNLDHIRAAVWIFGSAYLGLNLPKSAQTQKVWDVPAGGAKGDGEPGSWGGHAVEVAAFTPKGVIVVTWGALKLVTWEFLQAYGEEIYAIISEDFLNGDGKTPNNGFDLTTLKADLKKVTAERGRRKRS